MAPSSDHVQISGFDGYSYTLSFGAPVTDPVVHIASVASTLQLQAGQRQLRGWFWPAVVTPAATGIRNVGEVRGAGVAVTRRLSRSRAARLHA